MGQRPRTRVLSAQLALFPLPELQLVRAAAQARILNNLAGARAVTLGSLALTMQR